jgi:hypothetical protein
MPVRYATATAAAVFALICSAACGSKKHDMPAVGTGGGQDASTDAAAAMPPDAGTKKPPAAPPKVEETPPAAVDAGTTPDAGTPPMMTDEDAGPACPPHQCKLMADDCNLAACDPVAGVCKLTPRADGTACGSHVLDNCGTPDTCLAGVCMTHDAPAGTPCGDQSRDCRVNDECDGHGRCVDKGVLPADTACGDHASSECDKPDTCDDQGNCKKNYALVEARCGDYMQMCKVDDQCDGLGHCIDQGLIHGTSQCP